MKRFHVILALALVLALASAAPAVGERAEGEHLHEWDYLLRECADAECVEVAPCWDAEEGTYIHDFTNSDSCLVCGAAAYCSEAEHLAAEDYDREEHALAACGVPGHFACDGLDHSAYGFDPEGHTRCFAEQTHHCDDCGRDYACAYSNSHVPCARCGRLWCDKSEGDHTVTGCGHRECVVNQNRRAHKKLACGHYACKSGDHGAAACKTDGHFNCDGKRHGECENCGAFLCDGADHTRLACGHSACDEGFTPEIHATFRAVYDGASSEGAAPHCTDHYVCQHPEDSEQSHLLDIQNCGKPLCNGAIHSTRYACGNHTTCLGDSESAHALCPGCDMPVCDENYDPAAHAGAVCGKHYICAAGYTEPAHAKAACETDGHYNCDGNHAACPGCGVNGCADGYTESAHAKAACGEHYICADGYTESAHAKAACDKHYICAAGYTWGHEMADCNLHPWCEDSYWPHSFCPDCDRYTCTTDSSVSHGLNCSGGGSVESCPHCSNPGATGQHAASCGTYSHYTCDGRTHTRAACGHYQCADGYEAKNHQAAACKVNGHYVCDGRDHTQTDCPKITE